MKVAITGCSGFVGRRVVLLALTQGYTVVGIDRTPPPLAAPAEPELAFASNPNFTFHEVDVLEYDQVLNVLRGCEAVIHLAGIRNPGDYAATTHNSNVVMSWNVLRAAAELNITRIAQASSVNIIGLVFSKQPKFVQFPIDESHPCLPDEPYGLSKLICEAQADTIVRRYTTVRIASLRIHWSIPSRPYSASLNDERTAKDLWGYVQEDDAAAAFLLAISPSNDDNWSGHERFFISAPDIRGMQEDIDTRVLREMWWGDVPVRDGWDISGRRGFFDCSKAERLLGWKHRCTE